MKYMNTTNLNNNIFAIKPKNKYSIVSKWETSKCFMQAEGEGNDVINAYIHIGLGIHAQFDYGESLLHSWIKGE